MKVTLFKSADGSLHESAKACAKNDITLRVLAAALAAKFDKSDLRKPEESRLECYVLAEDDIPRFLANNADALRKLLNEALIAKRPRKAKKIEAVALKSVPVVSTVDEEVDAELASLLEAA